MGESYKYQPNYKTCISKLPGKKGPLLANSTNEQKLGLNRQGLFKIFVKKTKY